MDQTTVVTPFLRQAGEVLLLCRANDAETYPGHWGTVMRYVEHGDPLAAARAGVREETTLTDFELIRRGEPVEIHDREVEIHPVLFNAGGRETRTDEGIARTEWTAPTAILRRETVPGLWTAYDRVRPTPETVATDDEHGSAYLSIRALEVLRDEAGLGVERGDGISDVRATAEALLEARPSMAALENRVNRAVAGATTPAEGEQNAIDGIERALGVDETAAERTAGRIGGNVLTLSRSGTVLGALQEAAMGIDTVTIAESRPAREGVDIAETLASVGLDVRVCTDAAIAHVLAGGDIDCVLVGADTVLPDGRVVNKVGTRGAAIAADHEDVPVYVVAASDKISTRTTASLESGSPSAVYDGNERIEASNPIFDVTPAGLIDVVITERGALSRADIAGVASELRELGSWHENR